MDMELFTERHASKILGTLSCFDRIVITGTLPGLCYAQGMTGYFNQQSIRIFDYPNWAKPLGEGIRANAEELAQKNNLEIEFVRKANFRKEERVHQILAERGDAPGLVHIFSALELCQSFKPWHDKRTHETFLKPDSGKCLHYYFYFILPELGLCYLRVPTWAPFRLQFYCNGHGALQARLGRAKIPYRTLDNAFVEIGDWLEAQALSNSLDPAMLHKILDRLAAKFCPVLSHFPVTYHWSLMQVEYATDIVFRRQSDLAPIYEELVRTAIHCVKPDNIATFLGRRLTGRYQDEAGNDFHTRIEGTRIKHHMGLVSIKMYDKFAPVLRIEITANDVSFFKHHRKVEHRDGSWEMKDAPLKKSIYSLPLLVELMAAANRRYLEFISAIDDPTPSLRDLEKLSKPTADAQRTYRGFNLFHGDDLDVFRVINRGEFNIGGFRNHDLRRHLAAHTSHQISRILKRLRKHGLIKKVGKIYKYYLTAFGRKITALALKLREMFIIPSLRGRLEV
jgi:hypothetical protein